MPIGDSVPPDVITGIHSSTLCEDGRTVLTLFDLKDGRTGATSYQLGSVPRHRAVISVDDGDAVQG